MMYDSFDPEKYWLFRAPLPLLEAQQKAEHAVHCVWHLTSVLEEISCLDIGDKSLNDALARLNPKTAANVKLERLHQSICRCLVETRDAAAEGRDRIQPVEELFGAIAQGTPQVHDTIAESYHRLAIELAQGYVERVLEELGIDQDPEFDDSDAWEWFRTSFDESMVCAYVTGIDFDTLREIDFPTFEWRETDRLSTAIRQELFRAWKTFYTSGSYLTLRDASETKRNAIIQAVKRPKKPRPALGRDTLWLKWKTEERLTPAKIRDRWDRMSDEQRKRACPTCWKRVGESDPNLGREVVKMALRKTEAELQLKKTAGKPRN